MWEGENSDVVRTPSNSSSIDQPGADALDRRRRQRGDGAAEQLSVDAEPIQGVRALTEQRCVPPGGREHAGCDGVHPRRHGPALRAANCDGPHDRLAAERQPVDVPRDSRADHVRDRRDDVDRLGVPAIDEPPLLARILDEERDSRDVGEILPGNRPRGASRLEADPVVGGHHDERAIVQTGLLQTSNERAHEPVDIADLQEVPLERLVDEERRGAPSLPGVLDSRDGHHTAVLPPRREEGRTDRAGAARVRRRAHVAPPPAVAATGGSSGIATASGSPQARSPRARRRCRAHR